MQREIVRKVISKMVLANVAVVASIGLCTIAQGAGYDGIAVFAVIEAVSVLSAAYVSYCLFKELTGGGRDKSRRMTEFSLDNQLLE